MAFNLAVNFSQLPLPHFHLLYYYDSEAWIDTDKKGPNIGVKPYKIQQRRAAMGAEINQLALQIVLACQALSYLLCGACTLFKW